MSKSNDVPIFLPYSFEKCTLDKPPRRSKSLCSVLSIQKVRRLPSFPSPSHASSRADSRRSSFFNSEISKVTSVSTSTLRLYQLPRLLSLVPGDLRTTRSSRDSISFRRLLSVLATRSRFVAPSFSMTRHSMSRLTVFLCRFSHAGCSFSGNDSHRGWEDEDDARTRRSQTRWILPRDDNTYVVSEFVSGGEYWFGELKVLWLNSPRLVLISFDASLLLSSSSAHPFSSLK